jgi:hypothetical protein
MRESADMQPFPAGCAERALAEVATRQHGVVSLAQLRAAGLGAGAIRWRVRRGWLHRVHQGVYAVGHRRLTARGRMWAAVLACGGPGRAALSHWSAAAAWDLCAVRSGPVDVTVAGGNRSSNGIRVHGEGVEETTTVDDGLPVTTVARTLRALATTTDRHRLERVIARAEHRRLLDAALLAEQFGRRGGRRLEAALGAVQPTAPDLTRSELEERFLALVAGAGLPRPRVNQVVAGHEVDFVWRDRRLIVETDGRTTHLTATAFERDRRRDAELTARGWRVVRFTWRQVVEEERRVVATLRRLLSRR